MNRGQSVGGCVKNCCNSLDADFTALRVWRDLDKDGKTDAGELKTLAETGITSISLTTTSPASSQLAGNPITAQSTVTFVNGQSHVIADVILAPPMSRI